MGYVVEEEYILFFSQLKMYQSRHSCQIEATRESILYLDLDLETLEPLLKIFNPS